MSVTSSSTEFVLAGDLSIRCIAEVATRLKGALSDSDSLVIRFGDVSDLDLTTVQLLEAARKSAHQRNGRLTLSEPAHGDLLTLLQRGGFIAPGDTNRREFWLHEAN